MSSKNLEVMAVNSVMVNTILGKKSGYIPMDKKAHLPLFAKTNVQFMDPDAVDGEEEKILVVYMVVQRNIATEPEILAYNLSDKADIGSSCDEIGLLHIGTGSSVSRPPAEIDLADAIKLSLMGLVKLLGPKSCDSANFIPTGWLVNSSNSNNICLCYIWKTEVLEFAPCSGVFVNPKFTPVSYILNNPHLYSEWSRSLAKAVYGHAIN